MGMKYLNAKRLKRGFISAANWVDKNKEELNELNVYPVPDGDTGTNMALTLNFMKKELEQEVKDIDELIKIVSEAVLLGARGNSGTILSQIIYGFLKGIEGKEKITSKDFAYAMGKAKEMAYASVDNPVEGTILSVVKAVAEEAKKNENEEDITKLIANIEIAAYKAVEKTPEQLKKLKDAGVVDAGGKGFFYFIQGILLFIKEGDIISEEETVKEEKVKHFEKEDLTYLYCTEFIVSAENANIEKYKKEISALGDSMITVNVGDKIKTHVHTNNPGQALEIALKYGQLVKVKIENMGIQHEHFIENKDEIKENQILLNENPKGKVDYILIADTKEIADIFLKEGASAVILGGQGNNPSVSDIEKAINELKAEDIIILPNNKNIVNSAKLASERSNKNTWIIETISMLQGHYVLKNKEIGMENIVSSLKNNFSIEITKAIRNTKVDNLIIEKNDYIAVVNGKIKLKSKTEEEILKKVFDDYIKENTLKLTIFEGKNKNLKEISNYKENINIEKYYGGQENYDYYLYIENRDPKLAEIAIVTDASSDLTKREADEYNIGVIPLIINYKNDSLKAGVEISNEEFWRRLNNGEIAKTSHPAPAEIKEFYDRLFARGYKKIISLFITSKLSGFIHSAKIARQMSNREKDIEIIDSQTVTYGLSYLAIEAAKMAKKRESLENIINWIERTKAKGKIYFVVNNLKYLQKGGRIGKAASAIGGFLKMKPVLTLENGEVYPEKKVLGEIAAFRHIEAKIKEVSKHTSVYIYYLFGGREEEYKTVEKLMIDLSKIPKIENKGKINIGPVIGSHTGPIYGVLIYPRIN